MAQHWADEMAAHPERRLEELDQERHISPQPLVVPGAVLIVPAGLLAKVREEAIPVPALFACQKKPVELAATEAVIEKERRLGFMPVDVHRGNLGWDIESAIPESRKLRFIEVKGYNEGAETITISKNENDRRLNKP